MSFGLCFFALIACVLVAKLGYSAGYSRGVRTSQMSAEMRGISLATRALGLKHECSSETCGDANGGCCSVGKLEVDYVKALIDSRLPHSASS